MEIEKLTYKHLCARIGRRKTKRLRPLLTIDQFMAFNEFSQNHETFNQYIEGRHIVSPGGGGGGGAVHSPEVTWWSPVTNMVYLKSQHG